MNKIMLVFLMCALLASCQPKMKTTTKTSSNTGSNGYNYPIYPTATPTIYGTGTPTPTPTPLPICSARGTGSQTIEYYKINPIINKGSRTYGQVLWSSITDPVWKNKTFFSTDSRLNIRLLAKASPGVATTNYGASCPYASMPYTKLQVTFGVKAVGASSYSSIQTLESNVGDCSAVAEMLPPTGASSFQIDIFNVKWNYDCDIFYANASTAEKAQYCPYSYVWPSDCFDIQFQMATDFTRDIPQ